MIRTMMILVASAMLGGCGLAETGAAAAATGASAAEQARQAQQIEEKVRAQLDAAQQAAAQSREAAEKAAE